MRTILLLVFILSSSLSYAQVRWKGTYNGKRYNGVYDWDSLCCNDPNCGMRQDIIRRLQQQDRQEMPLTTIPSPTTTTNYTTITVQEPYTETVQVCVGKDRFGNCIFQPRTVTKYRTITKTVPITRPGPSQLPILPGPKTLPSKIQSSEVRVDLTKVDTLVSTPLEVVEYSLLLVDPKPGEVVIEPGCGDGRYLELAKNKYHCKVLGIELNKDTAEKARSKGIPVITGDARNYNYALADIVPMYLYPDLMKEIVPLLPVGTRVVSYLHDIPGIRTEKHEFKEHVIFVGVKR